MDLQVIATRYLRVRPIAALLLASAAITTLLGLAIPTTLPAGELRQERVQVSDLNLATRQGQRQLQRRVTAAIERVCTPAATMVVSNVRSRLALSECRHEARAGVQRQLAASGALLKLQVVQGN
jgi:UrcA family protein